MVAQMDSAFVTAQAASGLRLRAHRKVAGVSARDVAAGMGLSRSRVVQIEGQARVHADVARRYLEALLSARDKRARRYGLAF